MSVNNYAPKDPTRSTALLEIFDEWYEAMNEQEKLIVDKKISDISDGVKNLGTESVKELLLVFFYLAEDNGITEKLSNVERK